MYENIVDLYWVTGFYTVSNASIYYVSYYLLIPKIFKKNGIILFLIAFIFLAFLNANLMYLGINLVLENRLEELFQSNFSQIILIYSSSNLFTGAILLGFKGFLDNRKLQRINELKEKERIETELQFLKSQVNPHFLFNTINSVYVLIRMDPEKASETLIKLSNLLRSQLYEFSVDRIDIQKELEYLENYVELEKIRKGDRLDLKFEFEGDLEDFEIAPLVMIPFLENCFKHLSTHTDKTNEIIFRISRIGDELKAYFYNTTDENPKEKKEGGLGLNNIRRRLDLIYPEKHGLEIIESVETFEVWLTLKIN